MSKVDLIIQEINHLPQSDLEILVREIQQKLERLKKVKAALKKVKGAGKGVWKIDAQEFVNQSREDR
ncbi:MAG: hypothetical protein Q7T20_08620 [Saprospiraceae bacterium]|nr:hypothetical protein [Saprospiraceae bacterium]